MPGSETWLFLGKALGANPLPLAFGEIYPALKTGAIDGQDNPLPTVRATKFYEVTKQVVMTDHLVDSIFLALAGPTWNKPTINKRARSRRLRRPQSHSTTKTASRKRASWTLLQGTGPEGLQAGLGSLPLPRAEGLSRFRVVQDLAEGHGRAYQRRQVSVASIARRSGMAG